MRSALVSGRSGKPRDRTEEEATSCPGETEIEGSGIQHLSTRCLRRRCLGVCSRLCRYLKIAGDLCALRKRPTRPPRSRLLLGPLAQSLGDAAAPSQFDGIGRSGARRHRLIEPATRVAERVGMGINVPFEMVGNAR